MIAAYVCLAFTSQPVLTFTVDGERWTVTVPTHEQLMQDDRAAVEIRGPHRTWCIKRDERDPVCKLLKWPFPGPLVGVRFMTDAGHGVTTYYFTVRHRQLVRVVKNDGEAGGPEFWYKHPPRMVFDDYDYYNHWDKGGSPDRFFVYDVLPSGRAKLLRSISNPKNRRLPSAMGW
jgi:hypothetical protein